MSTTSEAADFYELGQLATSNSAALLNPSPLDVERWCSECNPKRVPAAVICLSCKVPLCSACDSDVVHNSKASCHHLRMTVDKYLLVKHALGHSVQTDEQIHADDKNKFCFFSPIDHHIHLQPRLAALVPDPDARPSLVSFIGPTGVGKSSLLRILVSLQGDTSNMPVVGAPSDAQSTSADIHMYAGGQLSTQIESVVNVSTYPLLYVDSEGRGGSKEPRGLHSMWTTFSKFYQAGSGNYEDFQNNRFEHVEKSYPRMLYIFSDVLCFVFQGNWRERKSIVTPLLEWGQSAAAGAPNQHRPQLILIFNMTGPEALEPEFNDFRKTYEKWIQGDNSRSHKQLQLYYLDPVVCLIPQEAIDATVVLSRVKMLRKKIHECIEPIRKSREMANQLFTRRHLQLHMQLAADTFSKDPNAEFDIYTASMARRPPSGELSEYIVHFRRAVEQANSKCESKSERYMISLNVLQMRIKLSALLWIGRLNVNVPVGSTAKLPLALRKALEQAQTEIDGDQPCAAEKSLGVCRCNTIRRMHENARHASTRRGKAELWDGDFTPYAEVQRAANDCRLVALAESALWRAKTLDVKEIQIQLSKVRQSECNKYPWLKSFTFYQVCVSCMVELPTEVLSCGHIICAMCAKELADSSSSGMHIDLTCPVCLSSAKWYPKNLPPLAGYRILSLDGGGVRGIVELLSLKRIMSFFPGMHVKDLFDIIVGTSTGGIIALALTVHTLNEEPKSLPEVIELFRKLCRRVFSSKMLRVGAGSKIILRMCQFLRICDTKYRNDNLLKLLEENFGEQLLLGSCVGGPHVIVTSCDRDNLASAYFTSYNREILEDECDDLFQQPHRKETEQPTRKLGIGRVPNNHIFSVKDAAAATLAAGTYFPSYKAGNQWWVDGGLQLNCPAIAGIKEARILSRKHRTITLVSLGCGRLLYDEEPRHSESLISFLNLVVDVITDSELQCDAARSYLKDLQPDSSKCSVRLNPTIKVPRGKKCELDQVKEIPFLMIETEKYLDSDGLAYVHEAANLVFAALFYVEEGIDQDSPHSKLDRLSIRSRTALPLLFQDALMTASSSSSPPFSVTVLNAFGVKTEFLWGACTWDRNIMNLPFMLTDLPMLRPLTVDVKLHMCLPETTAPKEWSQDISGMPCKLGAANR